MHHMMKKVAVALMATFALSACATQAGGQLDLHGKAKCAVKKDGHYAFEQVADCSNRGH